MRGLALRFVRRRSDLTCGLRLDERSLGDSCDGSANATVQRLNRRMAERAYISRRCICVSGGDTQGLEVRFTNPKKGCKSEVV